MIPNFHPANTDLGIWEFKVHVNTRKNGKCHIVYYRYYPII